MSKLLVAALAGLLALSGCAADTKCDDGGEEGGVVIDGVCL